MADLFLGLDCSTQSLTTIIINFDSKKIIFTNRLIYDNVLPHYNTKNGVYFFKNGIVHSDPLMWVEALELSFEKLVDNGIIIEEIKAISGSGQQHGTVYLNKNFKEVLRLLDSKISLKEQLKNVFSRKTSPIWMDSSTQKQCEEIRKALGGLKSTITITGSNTFERFAGPQIRKFYQEDPNAYIETSKIHLISSFISSLLLAKNSPIDHGDGAGMNLMNIKSKEWDLRALEATAPNLKEKLPPLCKSYDIIGKISSYFVDRYGFSPETLLVSWSGDNPNSLIGIGITKKGKVGISLGTSDTYFSYMKDLHFDLKGEGHVFGAPTGDYMGLICYKNGSLAREKIKDKFNLTWEGFSRILNQTPPGNYGKIMLPYFFPEIVPFVLEPKIFRFGFDENDLEGNVRAIIEAQFLSMRLHSEWINERPKEIYATGGASANKEILQVAANIFDTEVRIFEISDSAALGAALRSVKSYYDFLGKEIKWSKIVSRILHIQNCEVIKPSRNYKELYADMLELYRKCEDFSLKNGENPERLRKEFIEKYFKNKKN
ncbi:MAG: xylulokinase [Promethearchaeota archaeon]